QRRTVGGPYDVRADPAHQPRSHPPRRRNRLYSRSLRTHHQQEGELTMPGQAPIVGDESDALRVFLDYHQGGYLAVDYGRTDEQARSTPTVSALSIGGLIKHATGVQRSWMQRVEFAPDFPPPDTRPMAEVIASYQDEHVMRDDETLEQLLDALR